MIVATEAIAPLPWSPHSRTFSTGSTMVYPHYFNLFICSDVIGWSHIIVFMAGAAMIGFYSWFLFGIS
jgi:hypothetical protein